MSFTFTVLICTRDRPEQLDRCLASVRKLDYPGFDVLVVDSAPQKFPVADVAQRWGARYIFEPIAGVSRARNCGARACHTDIVAMLDDEAVADPRWLVGLAREFEDAQVMAVAGRIIDFEAHSREERLCAALGGHDCGDKRRIVDPSTPQWFERACFGGIGTGGNLAFRREAFDVWPGFCESLGAGTRIVGAEEHYAFFALIERGYRVVYTPEAIVSHPFPPTLAQLRARRLRNVSASVGYMSFLLFELPQYRGRILKYIVEGLRGVPRTWRGESGLRGVRINSHWRIMCAAMAGLRDCALVRFGRQERGVEPSPVAKAGAPAAVVKPDS